MNSHPPPCRRHMIRNGLSSTSLAAASSRGTDLFVVVRLLSGPARPEARGRAKNRRSIPANLSTPGRQWGSAAENAHEIAHKAHIPRGLTALSRWARAALPQMR